MDLQDLFHFFNAAYFQGRLPRYLVVHDYLSLGAAGETSNCERVIRIDPRRISSQEPLRELLLHEMCHINAPSHGKDFMRELLRLEKLGEPWARKQLDAYDNRQFRLLTHCERTSPRTAAPTWNEEMANLANHIRDNPELGLLTLRQATVMLAEDFGMSARELLKRAPWIRSTWKRARLDFIRRKAER